MCSTTPSQSSSRPLHSSGPPPLPPTHTSEPPWQVYVPGEHTPIELPQLPPPPGSPSSIMPSQSSSVPLHTSTLLPVLSLHTVPPFWQTRNPSGHRSASGPSHALPGGMFSSVWLLQL